MPQVPEWLLKLSTIISNIAVAAAAVVGIFGLWRWRRELVGKTKFRVARKIVLLGLQFRDEYGRARGFWTDAAEWLERKRGADEEPGESQVLDERFARMRRLGRLQDTLRKLFEVGWEAEAILSEEDANLVHLFGQLFQDLYLATEFYFEERLARARGQEGTVENEEMRRSRNIIYGVNDDEMSKAMDSVADKVKKQLKKYIR